MDFIKVTEQESNHKDLQKKTVSELVNAMHEEDNKLNLKLKMGVDFFILELEQVVG